MRLYKFLLWKAYLDKGLGLTNYVKYLLAFVGIFNLVTAKWAVIGTLAYIIFCFILGKVWYSSDIIKTENEISNLFNPFQEAVRKRLKIKRFK